MEYEISNRLSGVHGSMIRELFKLGASKDIISFGGGNPSAETFPCKEIEEIAAKGLGENPVSLLQYGLSEGYTPLRDTMKKYLEKKEGFDFENNELFIVSGGQQCADLTTKALVNLYEAPVATIQEKLKLNRVASVGIIAAAGCVVSLVIQGIVSGWMDAEVVGDQ